MVITRASPLKISRDRRDLSRQKRAMIPALMPPRHLVFRPMAWWLKPRRQYRAPIADCLLRTRVGLPHPNFFDNLEQVRLEKLRRTEDALILLVDAVEAPEGAQTQAPLRHYR